MHKEMNERSAQNIAHCLKNCAYTVAAEGPGVFQAQLALDLKE